jgi:ABC-type branched-subunit amino acid transport system substrate-binding protein
MRPAREILVATAALAWGCTQDPTLPAGTLAPVKIGTITSLTGDLGAIGPSWRDVVLLAAQEVNAAGGPLPGRLVEVVVADDETNPEKSRDAALSLLDDDVVGIVGAPGSSSSLEAAAVTGEAHVPQISGTSTSPALNAATADGGDAHPFFFRTVPSDTLQGIVAGDATRGLYRDKGVALDCQRLAIFHNDDDYGNPFSDAIVDRFLSHGGTAQVVANEKIVGGVATYADQIQAVIDLAPDCVSLVVYPTAGGTIVREWYAANGPDVGWIGGDGCKDSAFALEAGENALGIYGTAAAADVSRGGYRAFSAAYRATYGVTPENLVFGESVYDATALLLLAIAHAGTTDGETIRESLFEVARPATGEEFFGPGTLVSAIHRMRLREGIDYDGAASSVDFLDNGDVPSGAFEVWQWNGAEFERLLTTNVTLE